MKKFLPIVIFIIIFITVSLCVNAQSNQVVTNGDTTNTVKFPGVTCTYNWVNNNPAIGLPASGSGNITSFTAVNTGSNPVTATITATPINGEFAYIANNGDNTVSVINTINNMVVAHLTGFSLPYGVVVGPDNSKVYITNIGAGGFISVLNTADNTLITKIPVEQQITGIAISPDGTRLYASENVGAIAIINTTTNTVITTVPADDPLGLAVSPEGFWLYEANPNSGNITKMNTATHDIVATTYVGLSPTDVVLNPNGSIEYVAVKNSNYIAVVNAGTGAIITNIPVGAAPFGEVMNSTGTLLYVTNSGSGTVSVINTVNNNIISTINVGTQPQGISITPDDGELFVTNSKSNNVSVINTANNTVIATLPVGTYPLSLGKFISGKINCDNSPVTFTITVNSTSSLALISATSAKGEISACEGSPSVDPYIQQFTVSGINLTSAVVATAPAGFEVSTSQDKGYGNNVNVTIPLGINGAQGAAIVYVRSSASASSGPISGNVVLTSAGASAKNVAVSGIVNSLPTVDAVSNQIVTDGLASAPVSFNGTGSSFTWVNNTPGIGLPASGTGNISPFTAINKTGSPIVAQITVTPSFSSNAYIISHTGNNITVINTANGQVVNTIPSAYNGPYGIAVSHDGKDVYVTNNKSNILSVINTVTNLQTAIATVPNPWHVCVNADNTRVYVASNSLSKIYVFNAQTNSEIAEITVGKSPQGMALSPDGSMLYVCNITDNTLSIINTATNIVTNTIYAGSGPFSLVVSPDGSKLYVTNFFSNLLTVISTSTNAIITAVTVGNTPVETAISPDGSRVYVTNEFSQNVSVINTTNNTIAATIPVGNVPLGISITPDGSQVYVANNGSNTVSVINTSTNTVVNTSPTGANPTSYGNFISSPGCPGLPVTFSITVNPSSPVITSSGTIAPLNTVYGTPSSSSSFTVSGINLNSGITVTPPIGFEVSTDGINFTSSLTIGSLGAVPSTTVYIRLAATSPVNIYTGNVVLSASNANNVNINVPNSNVSPTPLTITANNQTKTYGTDNPELTLTYSGFVNNEDASVLIPQPTVNTLATALSAVGKYPILISGAGDNNYDITYVSGILTILPVNIQLVIPNAFTPNGDGINDTWVIDYIEYYPNTTVNIFNRYGEKILTSTGYGVPWDGTYKGVNVPAGTYYYIIDTKSGNKPISGWVAVIR